MVYDINLTVRSLLDKASVLQVKKCLSQDLDIKPQKVRNSTTLNQARVDCCVQTFVHVSLRDGNEESGERSSDVQWIPT